MQSSSFSPSTQPSRIPSLPAPSLPAPNSQRGHAKPGSSGKRWGAALLGAAGPGSRLAGVIQPMGKGLLVGARGDRGGGVFPAPTASCIGETHKVAGLDPNLRQQLPGEMQADLELPLQLLQAQGGPPWGPRESPDTSSSQEQGKQQKAEP